MPKNEILNDQIKPYNESENKTEQLVRMFNGLSDIYDRFNDLVSFGFSHSWRRRAIRNLNNLDHDNILDLATGTADMCISMHKTLQPDNIVGIDISEKMIQIGKNKINALANVKNIHLFVDDSATMQFPDQSFDIATISFGIRNFEKLGSSLRQIHRVLKNNGHFLIVEVNEPQSAFLKFFYNIYVRGVFKLASLFLSKDKKAFHYLANTMGNFPQGKKLIEIIENEGFKILKFKKMTLGVCSYYLLKKV